MAAATTTLRLLYLLWLGIACAYAAQSSEAPIVHPKNLGHVEHDGIQYFGTSDTVLLLTFDIEAKGPGTLWRSDDAGQKWHEVEDVGGAVYFVMHPYDDKIAFAFSLERTYWVTHNRGKDWKEHKLRHHLQWQPYLVPNREILSFHAKDPRKIIFNAIKVDYNLYYEQEAWYSKDGVDKANHLELLYKDTRGCSWVHGTTEFREPKDEDISNRIMCKIGGKRSSFDFDQRLIVSDNFFKEKRDVKEPILNNGRSMQGVIDIAHTKGYLIAAARTEDTAELAMFVSLNGLTWHQAEFGGDNHPVTGGDPSSTEQGYTILESTNYTLQVAVTRSDRVTTLMSSNSNGTYFSEDKPYLNRNAFSFVDFERVMSFEGVVLVNTKEKDLIKSSISFHDGRDIRVGDSDDMKSTWQPLKSKDEDLHLHSVTDKRMRGRVYSSAAPGVLMGIGNTGEALGEYKDGHLYVSNDAGRTWRQSLEGPHKYAFGDHGNILIAIPDAPAAKSVTGGSYSIDHGNNWSKFEVDTSGFKVDNIFTAADSSSRTFLITAHSESGSRAVYSLDFDKILPDTCKNTDFENFEAIQEGQTCVMGHRQIYRIRKPQAKCFVRESFEEMRPTLKPCQCTDADFECKFNFKPSGRKCIRMFPLRQDQCENGDTFRDESGFQLIPENNCQRKAGPQPDEEEIERPCSEAHPKPHLGGPRTEETLFDGETKIQVEVLGPSRSSQNKGETIYLLTGDRQSRTRLYKSLDHGDTWARTLEDEEIVRMFRHPYNTDAIFFVTTGKKVFYSYSRGRDAEKHFEVKYYWHKKKTLEGPFSFHQDDKDTFIWMGTTDQNCNIGDRKCQLMSQYTKTRGASWHELERNIGKCDFIEREGRGDNKNAASRLLCSLWENEDRKKLHLYRTDDFFKKGKDRLLEDILQFETSSEFVVAASQDEERLLFVNASVSGGDFAAAKFPPKFGTAHESWTVLQGQTHAVMLFATVSDTEELQYGRILKSNSNGTSYVTNIDRVHRNDDGYVDFNPIAGLEGVSVVNIVADVPDSDGKTTLQTRITHNDGANWAALDLPEVAKHWDGRPYDCRRDQESCKLHLFGYTVDKRPHASKSAVGILIGTGNVGPDLDQTKNKDGTFISTDGGLTWREARNDKHFWAYGDQGSLIVLALDGEHSGKTTDSLIWSSDEGNSWNTHQFDNKKNVSVLDLTTVPSGNSKNFVVWGKHDGSTIAYKIDFSGTRDRDCKLNDGNIDDKNSDYVSWSPKHPKQKEQNCLFGHELIYHRKKPEASCWNGPLLEDNGLHEISHDCECIREDFECDYNFEMNANGECILVPGLSRPDHSQACRDNSSLIEYYEPTGFRRIPMDTCVRGLDFEKGSNPAIPCPGHEPEFDDLHRGLSGFAFFVVAIALPILVAGGVGYWVFRRWDGKFGAIRLGETPADNMLDTDKPWVKYPIVAASAIIAVVLAIPGIAVSVLRSVQSLISRRSGQYTTRDSFARNRGQYMPVDEEELLSEDEDEET